MSLWTCFSRSYRPFYGIVGTLIGIFEDERVAAILHSELWNDILGNMLWVQIERTFANCFLIRTACVAATRTFMFLPVRTLTRLVMIPSVLASTANEHFWIVRTWTFATAMANNL